MEAGSLSSAAPPQQKASPPQCRGDAVFESPHSNMGVASIPGCVIRALVPDGKVRTPAIHAAGISNELAPSGLSYRLPKIGRLSTSMAEKSSPLRIAGEPAKPCGKGYGNRTQGRQAMQVLCRHPTGSEPANWADVRCAPEINPGVLADAPPAWAVECWSPPPSAGAWAT